MSGMHKKVRIAREERPPTPWRTIGWAALSGALSACLVGLLGMFR